MKTRVMLFNSPTIKNQFISSEDPYFPIGVFYLSSVLKSNNIETLVLDINNEYYMRELNEDILQGYIENNLYKMIKNYSPNIIGIGGIFSGAFKSLKLIAKGVKERFKNIPIVIGGIHATLFAKEILGKYSYIDYVVLGEGESTFLKLVICITENKGMLESIDGIAYKYKGSIKLNPKTIFENRLDALPFIDYSIVNLSEYKWDTSAWYNPKKLKFKQPFPIVTSRSCSERCNFCCNWLAHGLTIRSRTPNNVLTEMEHLYNNYNARYFHFIDDNMTFDKKRTLAICKGIIKLNMKIHFDTPNGIAIKTLDQEVIDALVEAGMIRTNLAIESGSEYIRNRVIGKGLKDEKIYEVIEACAKHSHLFLHGLFIIGMPEETNVTLEKTYQMVKNLPLDKISIYFATPYPGTKLFNYCIQHRLISYKMEDYVDFEQLQQMADKPHFKPHKLTINELMSFQKKCYDYLKEKRRAVNLPNNYPLRYKS